MKPEVDTGAAGEFFQHLADRRQSTESAMATRDFVGKIADGGRKFSAFLGPMSVAALENTAADFGASPGVAQDFARIVPTAATFLGPGKLGKAGQAAKASTGTVGKTVVKAGKKEAKTARVIDATHFDPHSTIKHLDRRGRVIFDGVEVRAVRDLGHISTPELKRLHKIGGNPTDLKGKKLQLHHHKQMPHRAPGAAVVEIPKDNHSIGNKIQHPHGNKKGMGVGPKVRADFNKFKRQFNRERIAQELRKRGEGTK